MLPKGLHRRGTIVPIPERSWTSLALALGRAAAPRCEADPTGPDLPAPVWLATAWLLLGGGWGLRENIQPLIPFTRTVR